MKRMRISRRASNRLYKRTARRTNQVNLSMNYVPRGGVRL